MNDRIYNVLFLCAGNSANCIMAEAILKHSGKGRFRAFSAYINPVQQVNPLALDQIQRAGLSSEGLRIRNWSEFTTSEADLFDFVITVCDQAVEKMLPNFTDKAVVAHWVIERTTHLAGNEEANRRAISIAFSQLSWRISIFISIPLTKLSAMALKSELDNIGHLSERRSFTRRL